MSVVTSVSPQAPDDVVAEVPAATTADVASAARAARAAQQEWWRATAPTRAGALAAAAG
ncbi:MAG: aldehyde dehydrogenase family protein, partial [Kineosporiaceae bacterium]